MNSNDAQAFYINKAAAGRKERQSFGRAGYEVAQECRRVDSLLDLKKTQLTRTDDEYDYVNKLLI